MPQPITRQLKILGIPIKIEASFLVLVFFLAGTRSLRFSLLIEWLLVVFFSILLHELGHALTGRKFGLSPSITLYSMGGLTSCTNTVELPPLKHLLISLAGPAAGFMFGGILLLLGQAFDFEQLPMLSLAYRDLLWVNIGWGVFNLLPMLPLDGGQILVTLESRISSRKDQILSHAISLLIALAIACLAFSRVSLDQPASCSCLLLLPPAPGISVGVVCKPAD
jgi:stage IV sporulation protein FB